MAQYRVAGQCEGPEFWIGEVTLASLRCKEVRIVHAAASFHDEAVHEQKAKKTVRMEAPTRDCRDAAQ
jgi:hypothetical protein